MNLFKLVLILCFLIKSISAYDLQINKMVPIDKGNGGDIIACHNSNGELIYKVLDSLIMESAPFYQRAYYNSAIESLTAIKNKLKITLPFMAYQLNQMIGAFYENKKNDSDIYWIESNPVDLSDEYLYVKIPSHCEPKPLQAVVFVEDSFKKFYYDKKLIDKISTNGNELSWLIIHEFLRLYMSNSEKIRQLNFYLHSQEFQENNEAMIERNIKKLLIRYNKYSKAYEVAPYGKNYTSYKNALEKGLLSLKIFKEQKNYLSKLLDEFNSTELSAYRKKILLNKELPNLRHKNIRDYILIYFMMDMTKENLNELIISINNHNNEVNNLILKLSN